MQKKTYILFGLYMLLLAGVGTAQGDGSVDVPLGHPVYAWLDRVTVLTHVPLPQMRPYSRIQIARFIDHISDRELSRTQRGLLKRYEAEFAQELQTLGRRDDYQKGILRGDAWWTWRDSVASVAVFPVFRQQILANRGRGATDETVSQTYIGGALRGTFRGFGFRVRHFEAREWSTQLRVRPNDVLAWPVESVQLKGHSADFRESTFQLAWGNDWLRLDVGKGAVDWGPGKTGNLLLGNHAPTYGLFRMQATYKRIRYVHLAGMLQAREGLFDTTRRVIDNGHVRIFLRQKRLAAHRLEIDFNRVTLGLQESVVYGDRDFEPMYVMPVTFFVGVQNLLENRDNLAMGVDVSWRVKQNLSLYGAWFFDDLAKLSPSAFSNKFGLQTGVFWVDPLRLTDTDVRLEYVRLEPFVYSHNFDVNTYEHYSALLGHRIGPNADLWHVRATHAFAPYLSVSALFERERQGENPVDVHGDVVNVGGNAQLGRRPTDLPVRDFMAGDVETHTRLGIDVVCEPIRNWVLKTTYRRVRHGNIVVSGGRGDAVMHSWMASLDVNFY